MSDSPDRLNLIQRAMQQGSFARKPAEPLPPQAVPVDKPAVRELEAQLLERQRAGNAAPMPAPPPPIMRDNGRFAAGPMVTLDHQRLRESRIATPENKASVTYNEFRAIKRKLLPLARDERTRSFTRNTIMVTSALPGEGKTFTVMNLAIGLAAERDLEVILVDGDVIRGSMARFFSGVPEEGLVELISDERRSIDEVLCSCQDIPNLHVLFAGRPSDHAPELMASRRTAEILTSLSRRYPQSIVLIDAPPVLVTAEPAALAPHIDHIIMLVAAGRTTRHQIDESLGELSACQNINLLVNKSPEWQRVAPAGYYYGYDRA